MDFPCTNGSPVTRTPHILLSVSCRERVLFSVQGGLVLRTTIGRLRLVGVLEGSSYLLLLGIAMPLKYIAGKPEMVESVGGINGLLFIWYSQLVLHAWRTRVLDLRWSSTAMIAAVLPFGPFVLDGKLRELSAQIE